MRKERGFALFLSMIVLMLIAITASALFRVMNSDHYISSRTVDRVESYYLVQAGKEYFLANMRVSLGDPKREYGAVSPATDPDGTVNGSPSNDDGNYTLGIYNYRTGNNDMKVYVSVDNATGSSENYDPSPEYRIQQVRIGK